MSGPACPACDHGTQYGSSFARTMLQALAALGDAGLTRELAFAVFSAWHANASAHETSTALLLPHARVVTLYAKIGEWARKGVCAGCGVTAELDLDWGLCRSCRIRRAEASGLLTPSP